MAKRAWTPIQAPPRPIVMDGTECGAKENALTAARSKAWNNPQLQEVARYRPAVSNLQKELENLKISYEALRQAAANNDNAYKSMLGEIAETVGDIAVELKDLEKTEPQITRAMAHLNDIVDKITTTVWGKGN